MLAPVLLAAALATPLSPPPAPPPPSRHLTPSNCWFDTYTFGQGKQLSCPHIHEAQHGYTGNCPVFASLEQAREACDQVPNCDAINFKTTGDTCFKNCNGAYTYINGGPNWLSSVRSCPPSPPTFPPSPPLSPPSPPLVPIVVMTTISLNVGDPSSSAISSAYFASAVFSAIDDALPASDSSLVTIVVTETNSIVLNVPVGISDESLMSSADTQQCSISSNVTCRASMAGAGAARRRLTSEQRTILMTREITLTSDLGAAAAPTSDLTTVAMDGIGALDPSIALVSSVLTAMVATVSVAQSSFVGTDSASVTPLGDGTSLSQYIATQFNIVASATVPAAMFPPSPPPMSSTGAKQDPHLALAYGGRADFRGRDGMSYSMISAPNVSVAMVIHEAIFGLNGNRINGSFMTVMHGVFRTTKGRFLYVTYDSRKLNDAMWSWKMVNGSCAKTHHRITFSMSPHTKRECDEIAFSIDVSTLSIKTPNWLFSIAGMPVYASYDGPTRRLDLTVAFHGNESEIRPHGLIGQSYDGTMIPRFGETDKYPMHHANASFVTQAMAKGAIDGIPDDYILQNSESTMFAFSRFDSIT